MKLNSASRARTNAALAALALFGIPQGRTLTSTQRADAAKRAAKAMAHKRKRRKLRKQGLRSSK